MTKDIDTKIASSFNALAHPRRARIFRLLTEDPASGQSFETLVNKTGYAPSALTHHLREMERCELIRRKRKGPFVAYFLTPTHLTKIMNDVGMACQTSTFPSQRAA